MKYLSERDWLKLGQAIADLDSRTTRGYIFQKFDTAEIRIGLGVQIKIGRKIYKAGTYALDMRKKPEQPSGK